MKYYLVYRQYSDREKHLHSDQCVFYGWSESKDVIKAFRSQRAHNKYIVEKADTETIAARFAQTDMPSETMIDFIPLKMASTKEVVKFFTTRNEMQNIEKIIQRIFIDQARLVDRDDGHTTLLELYMNLDEWYKGALEYIGFVPPELEFLFDSAEFRETSESEYGIEQRIDEAYDGLFEWPQEEQVHDMTIPGLCGMKYVHNKIIYSLESFIKAARDDL